jgi:hypothetical protein
MGNVLLARMNAWDRACALRSPRSCARSYAAPVAIALTHRAIDILSIAATQCLRFRNLLLIRIRAHVATLAMCRPYRCLRCARVHAALVLAFAGSYSSGAVGRHLLPGHRRRRF